MCSNDPSNVGGKSVSGAAAFERFTEHRNNRVGRPHPSNVREVGGEGGAPNVQTSAAIVAAVVDGGTINSVVKLLHLANARSLRAANEGSQRGWQCNLLQAAASEEGTPTDGSQRNGQYNLLQAAASVEDTLTDGSQRGRQCNLSQAAASGEGTFTDDSQRVGNAISCKLQHPEKAPSPYIPPPSIEVTPSGSTTLVRVASPANAPLRSMPCFFTLSAA
jgi:hypothetical protein